MKKVFLILTVATLVYACNNQQSSNNGNGFAINGTVSGYDNGYVYLHKVVDNDLKNIDSIMVKKGKFNLEGLVDFPEVYYLGFGDKRHLVPIFLENSDIEFTAQYDSLRDATIKGSKTQDEMNQYNDELVPFRDKLKNLQVQYGEAQSNNDTAVMNQLGADYEKLMSERATFIENYIVSHNKSAIAPYILSTIYYSMETNKLDSIVSLFDQSLDKSSYTKMIKKKVETLRNVEVGKVAPDFALKDTTGNEIALSSFKGKYLLIDFWASWCRPCRAENPNNVAIYNDYKDKGFEILGVSFDNKREDWLKGIKDDKLTWAQVSDLKGWKSAAGQLYGVNSIPHTVLLDKEGVIIAKNLRGEKLREKIAELLK